MRKILAIILVGLAAQAWATASADRSILIDGRSHDFVEDEIIFQDGEELAFDSPWGEFNDINQIKVSWNADTLFVAVDGYCWDNNIMLFLDTDPNGGIPDQGEVTSGWNRSLRFIGRSPDHFLGTWDNNTSPQMWTVRPGSSTQATMLSESLFNSVASFSQSLPDGSMEAALPWTTLFPDEGGLPAGAEIAMVAVVVTGADFLSGPDSAPNSSFDMPENSAEPAFIDNFLIIRPDRDGDGLADLPVVPNWREADDFGEIPPMEFDLPLDTQAIPLRRLRHEATISAFSPNGDGMVDEGEIELHMTRTAILEINVFDVEGRNLAYLPKTVEPTDEGVVYRIRWDGKNQAGDPQDPGLYFVRIYITGIEKIVVPLAVLR